MGKHTDIRAAILDSIGQQAGDSAVLFDGIPVFIEETELPAIAVYLTDAEYLGEMVDENDWQAQLHIAVFLPAQTPDAGLDAWMDEKIFPALETLPALASLISTINPQGYNYQRDGEMAQWAMAEITYLITYSM